METSQQLDEKGVAFMSRLTKIVLAVLIVVVCAMAIALVLVVINETATQRNADKATNEAEELRAELRCLRQPQLEYDKAESQLNILIGDGLADISEGVQVSAMLGEELRAATAEVERTLIAREEAIVACRDQTAVSDE
jgi:cell division protein FtsL